MSNYSKLTDFASKDALPSGNAAKIVKGTEIDDEFQAIESAISTKANTDSPALTGVPTAPTASTGTTTTQIATTAFVQTEATTIANAAAASAVGDLDLTADELTLNTNWTVTGSGTDLIFAYSGTNVAKLDSSGNLTVIGNVTAYGTI